MGCTDSKDQAQTPTTQGKIHGVPASANCMGPLLLGKDAGAAELENCDLMSGAHMKPEFIKKNPFHQVPVLEEADGFALGESNAILRYLAAKYAPELYPADPKTRARINFALDVCGDTLYSKWLLVVCPVQGFRGPHEDLKKARDDLKTVMDAFATTFVGKSGKFICGDKLTIADYKALPYLWALMQPVCEAKTGVKLSDRMKAYVEGVMAAVKSSEMLKSCGGWSLAEHIASKKDALPDAQGVVVIVGEPGEKCIEPTKGPAKAEEKAAKVHGVPMSCNALSPILLAKNAGIGDIEMCNVMEGAHKQPEFLAKNPFGLVPTFEGSDGFCVGESGAVLRYVAASYSEHVDPGTYPTNDPKVTARIDWAVDAFASAVYPKWAKIVYPVMGFAPAPEDQKKANEELTDALTKWETCFLGSGKYVCGNTLSLAEYKVLPYLFALKQQVTMDKSGFKPSEKTSKYADDIKGAISCDILTSGGGFSLAEMIASKA
mmetsp:Transcript_30188/g.76674  ORF Transcript_30188/g.76674 Transcript_30188/m.76674 type:complete len:490 (+) Transcript_30188:80-1549(+)